MTKGKYDINEGKPGVAGIPPSPQDASFKSCVCTMLILMALLLLVILWLYPLKQHDSPERDKMSYTSRIRGEKEERTEEKYFTSNTEKQFEKIIEYPTTQPSKPTIEIKPTQESTTLISILTTLLQTTAMTKAMENVTKTVNITTPFAEGSTESLTSLKHSTTPSSEVFIDFKTTKDVTSDTTTVSYISEPVEQITEASSGKLETSKEIESTNDLLYTTSVITENDDTVTSTTADIISTVMSSQNYTTTKIIEASEIYTESTEINNETTENTPTNINVTTMNTKEDESTFSDEITTDFNETTTVFSDDITTDFDETTTVFSDDITTNFDETTTVFSDDITTNFNETTTVFSDDITTNFNETTTVFSDDITTNFDETTTVFSDDITTNFDETTTVFSDDITTNFDETTTVFSDDITTNFDETTTVFSDDITTNFDETTTVFSDDITTNFDETTTVFSDDITTNFNETTTVFSDDITTNFDETTTVFSDDITTNFDETTTVFSDDITTNFDETTTVFSDDITTNFDETTTLPSDYATVIMDYFTTGDDSEILTSTENEPQSPHFERLIELKSMSSSPKDKIILTITETTPISETTGIDSELKGTESSTELEESSRRNEISIESVVSEASRETVSSVEEEDRSYFQKPSSDTTYDLLVATTPSTRETTKTSMDEIIKSTVIEPLPLQTSTTTVTTTTFVPTILPPTTTVQAPTVCGSESCKVVASRMLSLINHMQDPCEDFYQFACGGLRRSSTLLEENIADDVSKRVFKMLKNVNGSSSIIYQKLKTYYKSCVDYDKTVPLDVRKKQGRDIFNSVGSMVAPGTPTKSLTELLIQLFHYDTAPLFDINLDVDSKDTSKFTFVITQPKWMSSMFQTEKDKTSRCRYKPDENINSELNKAYGNYLKCLKNHTKFFDVAQEAMEAFNVFNGPSAKILIQETRMAIEWDVLELIEFLPMTSGINLDLQTKAFVERSVGTLQNNSLIEWGLLFEALFGFPVSNDTIVQVYFPKYFDKISYELKNKDSRKLHNALLGIFAHNLYTDLVQTNHPCDREQYCLKVAAGLMPHVVSNIYLQSFHSADLEDIVNKTSVIYSSLISTMKEQVTNSTWMDAETQQSVIRKLAFMTLGLPFHFNDSELQETYSELDLKSQNYLKDSVLLTRIYRKDLYSHYHLNTRSGKAVWSHFLNSFSTKTLYIYGTNTLVVPLSILLPLLDTSIPSYITMAKVGYHLAQGIAHGFERTGVLYDWYGGAENIISLASSDTYNTHVETSKTVFSYSRTQKEDKVYSFLMNSYQTLNFRLSDVTAAKLTLETARKFGGMEEQLPYADFTPHQTFHIILLQGFCTTKMIPESLPELFENYDLLEFMRVNYIAANIEDFGTAFKCIIGSTMNPAFRSEPFPVFKDEYPSYETAYT